MAVNASMKCVIVAAALVALVAAASAQVEPIRDQAPPQEDFFDFGEDHGHRHEGPHKRRHEHPHEGPHRHEGPHPHRHHGEGPHKHGGPHRHGHRTFDASYNVGAPDVANAALSVGKITKLEEFNYAYKTKGVAKKPVNLSRRLGATKTAMVVY